MTILGYTLPELRKSVVELIFAAAAVVAFFITFDPNLPQAVAAVALALIGVLGVYQAHGSYQDIAKAIVAVAVSGVALYAFFNSHFKPSDGEQIVAIVGAILNVGAVFFVRNEPAALGPAPRTSRAAHIER